MESVLSGRSSTTKDAPFSSGEIPLILFDQMILMFLQILCHLEQGPIFGGGGKLGQPMRSLFAFLAISFTSTLMSFFLFIKQPSHPDE